jgi:hypothetical protein
MKDNMKRILSVLATIWLIGLPVAYADTFAGRADFVQSGQNPAEKSARWGKDVQPTGKQVDAGACRILNPTITIRKDGTAKFVGQVASTHNNDAFCVILDFFDKNQVKLFHFPRICSQTLSGSFQEWSDPNLAIPQEHIPFIIFATLEAHC